MTFTRGEEIMALNAIRLWGKDALIIVALEEMSELSQALCKEMRQKSKRIKIKQTK